MEIVCVNAGDAELVSGGGELMCDGRQAGYNNNKQTNKHHMSFIQTFITSIIQSSE